MKGAKKAPETATKKKKDNAAQDKDQADEQYKFLDLVSLDKIGQPSSDLEACHGCGVLSNKTVSSIPCQADWPVSFPLKSTVELVSAWGLQPDTIISRCSVQLGGRIAHNVSSYEKIGTQWSQIDFLKRGYKPSWIG